jgi:hypothetical protein
MKFDANGNLFVSDVYNNRIRKINSDGIINTVAGIGTGATIFSVDSGDGGAATAASLYGPSGLTFDKAGNLYFTEYYGNTIRKINTLGIITTIAGNDTLGFRGDGGMAIKAEFHNPTDITIDTVGNLDISDQGNQRIREIYIDGTINTISGDGTYGFNGDGTNALLAQFKDPAGIAVDISGSIYISDIGNSRIRYIRNTVGITTLNNVDDNVLVYPNPSDGEFTILISSKTDNDASISITDELGRTIIKDIMAKTNEAIKVEENIAPGVYFLSVKNERHLIATTKLLINYNL